MVLLNHIFHLQGSFNGAHSVYFSNTTFSKSCNSSHPLGRNDWTTFCFHEDSQEKYWQWYVDAVMHAKPNLRSFQGSTATADVASEKKKTGWFKLFRNIQVIFDISIGTKIMLGNRFQREIIDKI